MPNDLPLMQLQLDNLTDTLTHYMERQEKDRDEDKAERTILFAKLDKAAEERKEIYVQTTATNGQVISLKAGEKRSNKRLDNLEGEQRTTLTERGKTRLIVGLIITIVGGTLLTLIKSAI